jgi:multiple sugar transport system permease protein
MSAAAVASAGYPRRRRGPPLVRLEPLLYLSPALVILALVMFVPLLVGLSYAFRNIQLFNPFATGWVGVAHFDELIRDDAFWHALLDTVWWTGGSLVFQFFLGLILALALDRPFYGRRLVQALVFVPWAVPTFLSGLAWAWLFNPVIGPLPHWLAAVGILSQPFNILADPAIAMWGPIVANVWFGIPFFAITLLAALQAIPRELYEAAMIDGAGAWQRFAKITLPFLAPTIAITVLLRTIWIANFADLIWVMTNGGPADSTQTLATYIFSTAYSKLDFGYASAVAAVLLLLLLLYALLLLRMRRGLLTAPAAA